MYKSQSCRKSEKICCAECLFNRAIENLSDIHNVCAVYAGDEMVGFVMFGFDTDDDKFYLGRLMIDEKHQGKGFGKAATLEVIERLKQNEDCKEIYLSFVPENESAEKLYKSIGFERTGELNGHEIVMRFVIEKN